MKVGDRVRFCPNEHQEEEVYGVIKNLHIVTSFGNYIGVLRDDGKEGGRVPGLWLVDVGRFAIVPPEPEPVVTKSRFEVAFEDLE